MLLTRILVFSELTSTPYSAVVSPVFESVVEFFFTASEQIDVIGKPQVASGPPPMDTDSFCLFYTASTAKQSFSDEVTCVRAFCMNFSRNIGLPIE